MNNPAIINRSLPIYVKSMLLVLTYVFIIPQHEVHAAEYAAKVIYSFGDVKSVDNGKSRELSRGDLVYSGETIATTRGRVQIRFSDGGFASLQPNTEYQINNYRYDGKADGNERSFLSLLKGSVRLVTGVIGKANRRNFRIKTAVATIGIRGTQGTLTHDPATNTTSLRGHGGEWDLQSGTFSGGVPAGQAYSCNGVSCTQVSGLRQRSEVARSNGKSQRKQHAYQQGQQTGPDGRVCDLGGTCGELAVEIEQVGAIAFTDEDGEATNGATDFLERLGVVTVNDKPIAFLADATTDNERGGGFVTTDLEGLRTAINTFGEDESDFVAEANQFLDELDPMLVADLDANPAMVADEDFATTSDGLVTYGRWVEGNILIASKGFETGDVTQRLQLLENFESVHFIYGDNLDNIEFTGSGIYTLTGATYPTAIDGSSMGSLPTSGSLTWHFGSARGNILLPVMFDDILFNITGSVTAPDTQDQNGTNVSRLFTDDAVAAIYTMGGLPMSAPASIDGFFTGANGSNAPLAAGLSYAVDYYSNPFVGVAAFGLAAQQAFVSNATIKYAFPYLDSTLMSLRAGFGGDSSLAAGTPLSSFTAFESGNSSFSQGSASIVDTGGDPITGAHFRRFSSNYNLNNSAPSIGGMLPLSRQFSFLAVKTDFTTPDSVLSSTTGTANFTLSSGSVTLVYDTLVGGFAETAGTLTAATFNANFTTGMMDSVTFSGAFAGATPSPITNFTLNSSSATPINSSFSTLSGTCAGCTSPTLTSGTTSYKFTSAFPGGPPVGVISNFVSFATVNSVPAVISGVTISK